MKSARAILTSAAICLLAACGTLPLPDPGTGKLEGRVLVEWVREDGFIYRKSDNPVSFKPSFMAAAIVPDDMYTDGGSIPRVFWNVPGLSPWGLGPAYIMHDWIFRVHRCDLDAPQEVKAITFEQSAQILAEVAQALAAAGLIENDRLSEIVWAIRTRYARRIWDRPGTSEDCRLPPPRIAPAIAGSATGQTVVDFTIPTL